MIPLLSAPGSLKLCGNAFKRNEYIKVFKKYFPVSAAGGFKNVGAIGYFRAGKKAVLL